MDTKGIRKFFSAWREASESLVRWHESFSWESGGKGGNNGRRSIKVKTGKTKALADKPICEAYEYPFLGINQFRYTLVHVDVDDVPDYEDGYCPGFDPETYRSLLIPLPNFVVKTSGSRFQAFWMLKDPFPCNATPRTLSYFRSVRIGLITALNGDYACNSRGAVRNPFCVRYGYQVQRWRDESCLLGDLDCLANATVRNHVMSCDSYEMGNRNRSSFMFGLRMFKEKEGKIGLDDLLYHIVRFQALSDVELLCESENLGIARSVLRNGHKYAVRAKRNYGAMQLPEVDWKAMSPEERLNMISSRRLLGVGYTNRVRKQKSRALLEKALVDLERDGKKANYLALAKAAGLDRNTVKRALEVQGGQVFWK